MAKASSPALPNHPTTNHEQVSEGVYHDPVTGGSYRDQAGLDMLRSTDKSIGTDVARSESKAFNDVASFDATGLDSFEDVIAEFEAQGITVDTADSSTVGDGYSFIDKSELVNRRCLFIFWALDTGANRIGDRGFLIIRGITADGVKFRITDGSTGLAQELRELSAKRKKAGQAGTNAGLVLPKGLKGDIVEGDTPEGTHYKTTIYRCAI